MTIWTKGDDYIEDGTSYTTYGIDKCVNKERLHCNAIEIYTCEADRDAILEYLQKKEKLQRDKDFVKRYHNHYGTKDEAMKLVRKECEAGIDAVCADFGELGCCPMLRGAARWLGVAYE
jgi:hypothetical protein